MDIMDLLKGAPGLLDSIKEAGVPDDKLGSLTSALGKQLGGNDGFDFGDLLGGLDLDGFLAKVDVGSLASQLGLSPDILQKVVSLIGPKIAEFSPGNLGGALGAMAGKLFD